MNVMIIINPRMLIIKPIIANALPRFFNPIIDKAIPENKIAMLNKKPPKLPVNDTQM